MARNGGRSREGMGVAIHSHSQLLLCLDHHQHDSGSLSLSLSVLWRNYAISGYPGDLSRIVFWLLSSVVSVLFFFSVHSMSSLEQQRHGWWEDMRWRCLLLFRVFIPKTIIHRLPWWQSLTFMLLLFCRMHLMYKGWQSCWSFLTSFPQH